MDFEVLRRRVQDERSVRAQRDAAEKEKIPSERLRREIRDAFAREDARKAAEEHPAASEPDSSGSSETARK